MKKITLLFSLFLSVQFIGLSQITAVKGKADYNFWLALPSDSVLKTNPPISNILTRKKFIWF